MRRIIGNEIPGLREKVIDHIDEFARPFIEMSPFLIMSTADKDGRIDVSPKGAHPGFVQIKDDRKLLIPDRPGNRMAIGHQNIIENAFVSILFIIPGTPETLRVNGKAELIADSQLNHALAARNRDAILTTCVHIEECFFHCAKAFIRSNLWEQETWSPRHRVSFGEMYAKRHSVPTAVAEKIDNDVNSDYKLNL